MTPHQRAFRLQLLGAPKAEVACGNFGDARPIPYWVDCKKNKNVFLRSFLLMFLLSFASRSHAQTAAELQDRSTNQTNASDTWPRQAVRGPHAMVATDEALGSQAGVAILKQGGNAVDAAVVEPAAGNIGGGGFMLVRLADGKTNFFDYREVASAKATRDMYIQDGKLIPDASTLGYRSVAVPGTVAGLELVLKTHGTMKLAQVMAPAIHLARDGFPISEKLVREFEEEKRVWKNSRSANASF